MGLLLPTFAASRKQRASFLVREALGRLGLSAPIVCFKAASLDRDHDEVNWTVLVDGRSLPNVTRSGLSWVTLEHDPRRCCVLAYQETALEYALVSAQAEDASASFAQIGWMDRLIPWVDESLPRGYDRSDIEPMIYRALPGRAVVKFSTARGPVFFKGLANVLFAEALLTRRLATLFPAHFARTLAFDSTAGWWLTAQVLGQSLRDSTEPPAWFTAGWTLAQAQINDFDGARNIDSPALLQLSLSDIARWGMDLLSEASSPDGLLERVLARISLANRRLTSVDEIPVVWAHTDPAPDNIFFSNDQVAFIDLAEPVLAPPVLTAAIFLVKAAQHRVATELADAFSTGFFCRWRCQCPSLPACSEQDLLVVGRLFEGWQQLNGFENRLRSGEIRAAQSLVRHGVATRLSKQLVRLTDQTSAEAR